MRVLFTCHPGFGTFLPLTPFARALAQAGHDVAFGTPVFLRATVEAAGFRWIRAGVENDDPEMAAARARMHELRGVEQLKFTYDQIFASIRPRRLVPELLALAESWRPDLFIRDSREFGALVAADLLGAPYVTVEVHAAGARPRATSMLYEPLRRLRASFGLPEHDIQGWMDRYLVFMPFPPSLTTVGDPIGPTTHYVRALPPDVVEGGLPQWLDEVGSPPLVYVSLGTAVSGARGREIFSKLLAGLRDLDAHIVMTVSHELDPAAFGPQPTHIHLERFLPLGPLLPRCSLVLFHGGSGTLVQAVAHGLPMVILPLGADQPDNARRCAELGISRTLGEQELTPEHVRETVLDVLHTPTYRQVAQRLRDEFRALPGPEAAVELLERLARDKKPILASR
jgi:UDP:flavonoid glycosyltransferase YjiC (YdhE family)